MAPETYVDECYKVETYLRSYSHAINPISGYEIWGESDLPEIIPPKIDPSKHRRPKKARKKHNVELENNIDKTKLPKKDKKMVCSVCHQEDHTKRKHTQAAAAAPVETISFGCSENMTSQASVSHNRPK